MQEWLWVPFCGRAGIAPLENKSNATPTNSLAGSFELSCMGPSLSLYCILWYEIESVKQSCVQLYQVEGFSFCCPARLPFLVELGSALLTAGGLPMSLLFPEQAWEFSS